MNDPFIFLSSTHFLLLLLFCCLHTLYVQSPQGFLSELILKRGTKWLPLNSFERSGHPPTLVHIIQSVCVLFMFAFLGLKIAW